MTKYIFIKKFRSIKHWSVSIRMYRLLIRSAWSMSRRHRLNPDWNPTTSVTNSCGTAENRGALSYPAQKDLYCSTVEPLCYAYAWSISSRQPDNGSITLERLIVWRFKPLELKGGGEDWRRRTLLTKFAGLFEKRKEIEWETWLNEIRFASIAALKNQLTFKS